MDMAVVGVKAVGHEFGQPRRSVHTARPRFSRIDSGPAHPDLEIDQDRNRPVEPNRRLRRAHGPSRDDQRSRERSCCGNRGPDG